MEKRRRILHKINLTAQIFFLILGSGILLYDVAIYLRDKPIREKFLTCVLKTPPKTAAPDLQAAEEGVIIKIYHVDCEGTTEHQAGFTGSDEELEEVAKGSETKLTLGWTMISMSPDGTWSKESDKWPNSFYLILGTSLFGVAAFLFALEKWILWLLKE